MNNLLDLQNSLDDLKTQADDSKNKDIAEKYKVIINGIDDTLGQIFKSGGIITKEEYDALDEQIKAKKMEFLKEDAEASRNRIILVTMGVIGVFGILYWLSGKKK